MKHDERLCDSNARTAVEEIKRLRDENQNLHAALLEVEKCCIIDRQHVSECELCGMRWTGESEHTDDCPFLLTKAAGTNDNAATREYPLPPAVPAVQQGEGGAASPETPPR
jgi:hypothetical protein